MTGRRPDPPRFACSSSRISRKKVNLGEVSTRHPRIVMKRLVGAIQTQQFLVFLKHVLFPRCPGQRAGLLRRRNRIVESSRLGVGCRQGGQKGKHPIMRQFAGTPGIPDGFSTIPNVRVRIGREQPRQIVQDTQRVGFDLQRLPEIGNCLVRLGPFAAAHFRNCSGLQRSRV